MNLINMFNECISTILLFNNYLYEPDRFTINQMTEGGYQAIVPFISIKHSR